MISPEGKEVVTGKDVMPSIYSQTVAVRTLIGEPPSELKEETQEFAMLRGNRMLFYRKPVIDKIKKLPPSSRRAALENLAEKVEASQCVFITCDTQVLEWIKPNLS